MRRRYSFATVLVGSNSLRREGLEKILRSENFRILASVSSADDLPSRKIQPCELLFLIVHNGEQFATTVAQIESFKERHPGARIAVVADHYQLNELVSAFRAGATGFFVDVMSCDAFIKSIELVMMGEAVFPPAFLSFALDAEGDHQEKPDRRDDSDLTISAPEDRIVQQLSPREKSILRCLIEGDSNKSIARKVDIAESTVKAHVKGILRKIRVQNRTQAAIWGINNRSLARQPSDKSSQLNAVAGERVPNPMREISEIKRIKGAVSIGEINLSQFELAHADSDARRDMGLKTDAVVRLRK